MSTMTVCVIIGLCIAVLALFIAGPIGTGLVLLVIVGVLALVLLVRLDRRVFDRNRKPRPDDRYRGPKV
jgi:membrane protein implicated in regulation of membrane protease activity